MTDSNELPQPAPSVASAGAILRQAREAQGLSVSEVANTLKLNPRQIEALESGRYDLLPGFAFAKGFLRNYARLLHLDPAPLLASLQPPESLNAVELSPASNAQGDMPQVGRGRFRRSVIPGVAAALLLLGVVVAGWYYDTLRKKPADDLMANLPTPSPAPADAQLAPVAPAGATPTEAAPAAPGAAVPAATPPEAAIQAAPAAVAPAATEAAPSAPPAPAATDKPQDQSVTAAGTDRLAFAFEQDAWVEVKDKNGKSILSRLGRAGDKLDAEGQAPFTMVIGNARYVKLERNGKPVDLVPATKVTVARLKLQ